MSTAAVSDSGGIRVVHLSPETWADVPVWKTKYIYSTDSVDSLSLGGGYVSARFMPDGSLLVADGDGVVLLDSLGHWFRRVARSGQGPGEYQQIVSLGLGVDGVAFASDYVGLRTTVFRSNGGVLGIVGHLSSYRNSRDLEVIGVLRGLNLVVVPSQWRPRKAPDQLGTNVGGVRRDNVSLVIYDSTGQVVDSIGNWLGLERASNGLVIPFARSTVYWNRGSITAVSPTDSLDLSIYDGTTLERRVIGAPTSRAPTTADYDLWKAAVTGSEQLKAAASQLFVFEKSAPKPALLPSLGGLAIDDKGSVWVGGFDGPGVSATRWWEVLSPEGNPIGRVEVPAYRVWTVFPSRTEILDIARDRLAILHEGRDGGLVIEVRGIVR